MNPPLVSIVLPTYNGSRYIRQSIESCLGQSLSDFELIVVNDCSTDDTPEIIEEYRKKDPRIKIIHNTFNKKLPLSLNTGFEQALGKYHTWTSDDNYYAPDALEKMVRILTEDPNIDLVYTDYSLVDANGHIFGARKFHNIYDSFTDWLGCGACFLYKEQVFRVNKGYNPGAFLIEDYDFFMRAFLQFNFCYLPGYELYFYREHPSSLTSTQGDVVNDLAKIMIERQMDGLEKKLPPRQLALLYRKFAVFNAVQKNNANKYRLYLVRLWKLSRRQAFITVVYVPLMKLKFLVTVSAAGWAAMFRNCFTFQKDH
ncbi:MAG TPA: glycosyltransferase family A protein [Puia sp.]|jgi:glycosyltransferase involved in cell wall biosynthesis